jgi:transcriptional regulator with XRE-family HTH domain
MKEINLAQVLTQKRHEKGITQDELAAYIGVSKASVSKWETGQSYPDITFLPLLASYFDISIDTLMNYSPQLERQEGIKIYSRLAADFGTKPFEDVINECELLVKKYYSCYPFLLELVKLYINHAPMAAQSENPERTPELVRFAISLCEHVINDCREPNITNAAVGLQAMCHLMLEEPAKVLELLGEDIQSESTGAGIIVSQAYQMLGNPGKAKEILQAEIYSDIMKMFNELIMYINLNINDYETAKFAFKRAEDLSDIFVMRKLNPNNTAQVYYMGAHIEQIAGNSSEAIKVLEKYTDVCMNGFFPFNLRGDAFFNAIDGWLAENIASIPRDEAVVKVSMLDIFKDPVFAGLRENPEFIKLEQKLKKFAEEN